MNLGWAFQGRSLPRQVIAIARDFPDKMLPKIGISLLDAVFFSGDNGGQNGNLYML